LLDIHILSKISHVILLESFKNHLVRNYIIFLLIVTHVLEVINLLVKV